MKSGPNRIDCHPDHSAPAISTRRRSHEMRSLLRSRPRFTSPAAFVIGLALTLGAASHAARKNS